MSKLNESMKMMSMQNEKIESLIKEWMIFSESIKSQDDWNIIRCDYDIKRIIILLFINK